MLSIHSSTRRIGEYVEEVTPRRWLSAFDESIGKQGTTPLPDVQLDFFMELYKKLFPNKAREDVELINWLNMKLGIVHTFQC